MAKRAAPVAAVADAHSGLLPEKALARIAASAAGPHKAKVNSSTELAEVLGPTKSAYLENS